jgi:enamine deaminase RidA (YjgF/YER057c/UK114 family)
MSAIRINPISVWQDPPFPFNQAVVEPAGRRVHLTGQVAWTSGGQLIGAGDAEMQTEYAIENIRRILAEIGGTLADVMSTTMYYVRDEDLPAIQQVRTRMFEKATGPAVTGVKVAGLVDTALLVELTVVAVIPEARFREPAAERLR